MTNLEKFTKICEHLNAGRTVQFCTSMVVIPVNKKHLDNGMIKMQGNSIVIQKGRRWDCVDYCAVRVFA